jgi:hypothetical protein
MGSEMEVPAGNEVEKRRKERFSILKTVIIDLKMFGLTNVEIAKVLKTKAQTIRHWTHIGKKVESGPYREFYLNMLKAEVAFRIERKNLRQAHMLGAIRKQVDEGTLLSKSTLEKLGIVKTP